MDADYDIVKVTRATPGLASIFLEHGRDYITDMTAEKKERFLQSILDLQGRSGRWLLLFKWGEEFVGFTHMRIGGDRPGWGWVMEFYVRPELRRKGFGTRFYEMCEHVLEENGASSIWLTTNPEAEPFWSSVGYRKTGERAEFNDLEIMEKRLLEHT